MYLLKFFYHIKKSRPRLLFVASIFLGDLNLFKISNPLYFLSLVMINVDRVFYLCVKAMMKDWVR